MTKQVRRIPAPSPHCSPRGEPLSESENAEAVADSLETQFLPVTCPSAQVVIRMMDVVLRSYIISTNSEPELTNPDEVQGVVRVLKFSKAPGPNGIRTGP
jgi:hypothetical protein